MSKFTAANTEGFSAADLATMNAAHDAIMASESDNYGYDNDSDDVMADIGKSVADCLNNAYHPGITKTELLAAWART